MLSASARFAVVTNLKSRHQTQQGGRHYQSEDFKLKEMDAAGFLSRPSSAREQIIPLRTRPAVLKGEF